MKLSYEYKKKEDARNIKLLRDIQKKLPAFTNGFFTHLAVEKEYSKRTVLGYARDIEVFFSYICKVKGITEISVNDLSALKKGDIMNYMAYIASPDDDDKIKPNNENSRARKLSSLKSFWKWMNDADVLKENPTALVSAPKIHKKMIVYLTPEEAQHLMRNAEDSVCPTDTQSKHSKKLASRDAAIIALLLGTGIRLSELVGLNLEDIDFKERSIRIIRKGGNESIAYFDETVEEYLRYYIENGRGDGNSSALFLSRKDSERLSARGVQYIVKKYAYDISKGDRKITPHKLRATYGTRIYQETNDIYLTANALGHNSVTATSRYAAINDTQKRNVAKYAAGLIIERKHTNGDA